MAGRSRSRSPYLRKRPSPPPRRNKDHSPVRRRSRSPVRRRRESSPEARSNRHYQDKRTNRYQSEIEGFSILPQEGFSDYRTRVRNQSTKTIWARSPERLTRSVSPKDGGKSKKKHSRKHDVKDSDSDSEDSSSEEEERRRRRHRSSKKHKLSSSNSRYHGKKKSKKRYSSEEESEENSESDRGRKQVVKRPVLEVDQSHLDAVKDLWVEKQVDLPDDLAHVGPVPLIENNDHDERAYGHALLPGEGSAMAAYVQQGKRIPRRGEIGLTGDQISDFEKAGYVMSGNRHQRMNAVRLRKENQVISAEEKRLVLQHAQEQKIKRENEIISGFREILGDKFKKEE